MKVLVATDGSEHSMKAVKRALEMAEREGAQVTLMAVALYSRGEKELERSSGSSDETKKRSHCGAGKR